MKNSNPIYILFAFGAGFLLAWYMLPSKVVKVQKLPSYEVVPNYVIELEARDTVLIQAIDTIYRVPFSSIQQTIINDNL